MTSLMHCDCVHSYILVTLSMSSIFRDPPSISGVQVAMVGKGGPGQTSGKLVKVPCFSCGSGTCGQVGRQ